MPPSVFTQYIKGASFSLIPASSESYLSLSGLVKSNAITPSMDLASTVRRPSPKSKVDIYLLHKIISSFNRH